MSDILKFNIEKLTTMKTKCEESRTELDTLNKELTKALEQLKKDWNTPAGKKFFEDLTDDWSQQVEQYKTITAAIEELLQTAINEYSPIQDEANALSI